MANFKTPKGTELPFLNLKGKDYLQVAYRILWLKEEHPDWVIKTQILKFELDYCVIKATIEDNDGRTISEAHQMTTKQEFPKFLAKCETSAIGRAIGMAGFGTLHAQELVDDEEDLSDSPMQAKKPPFIPQPQKTYNPNALPPMPIGEYICSFGKYKSMPIKSIAKKELENYVDYIQQGLIDSGKKPTAPVAEFLEEAKKCLK